MTMENYYKKEIIGVFQNANWQELYDLFRNLYDPLSLREFRGFVESIAIDDYALRHWLNNNAQKGFGELMISCAGKDWNIFKIRFYDSSDSKRFLKLDINCDNNKIVLIGSLDNKEKLDNTLEEISSILNVKIRKSKDTHNEEKMPFYKKWWFILIVAPIFVGLILLYFQNQFSNRQKYHFQSLSVNDIKDSSISGDVVRRDKIVNQTVISVSADQDDKDKNKQNKITAAKVQIKRIIDDLSLAIDEVRKEHYKRSERIANDFASRNMSSSGLFIRAQMDCAISTKEKIEKLLAKSHRDIEDVLQENFKIANLEEMAEFSKEEKELSELKENTIPEIYSRLEGSVKSWEIRSLGSTQITKDFKL